MNWIRKISVFVAAGILYLVGQYFRGFWWPYTTWPFQCDLIKSGSITYCDPIFSETWGFPLISAGEIFAFTGLILLFSNQKGFSRWLKFSYFYVPIVTAFIILVYPYQGWAGYGAGPVTIDVGVRFWGAIYVLISLSIVLWSRWKS